MAGFDGAVAAIWASVGVGLVNVIFTVVSVYFVDRLGRRKLYFIGLSGIVVSAFTVRLVFCLCKSVGRFCKMGGYFTYILLCSILCHQYRTSRMADYFGNLPVEVTWAGSFPRFTFCLAF